MMKKTYVGLFFLIISISIVFYVLSSKQYEDKIIASNLIKVSDLKTVKILESEADLFGEKFIKNLSPSGSTHDEDTDAADFFLM